MTSAIAKTANTNTASSTAHFMAGVRSNWLFRFMPCECEGSGDLADNDVESSSFRQLRQLERTAW
jgi:hypothetical protein